MAQSGASHHATEDLAILRALPGTAVISPGDNWEAGEATRAIVDHPGVVYLRLDKSAARPSNLAGETFQLGRARKVCEGRDVTLIATGGILGEAVEAAGALRGRGISARVLSMHTVKPLDREAICAAARETGGIVTAEEHTIDGGLGGAVAETLLEEGAAPGFFTRIGLRSCFSSTVGSQKYLRSVYGIDAAAIVDAVISRLPLRRIRGGRIMKRALDIAISATALTLASPVAARGHGSRSGCTTFTLRSTSHAAWRGAAGRSGWSSFVRWLSMPTGRALIPRAPCDRRITPIGRFVRAYKIDELTQLWNVLEGRYEPGRSTAASACRRRVYTRTKNGGCFPCARESPISPRLCSPTKGTSFATVLEPDLLYNQIIRPWKSRLALLCIDRQSMWLDLRLIVLTALAILSRDAAFGVRNASRAQLGADPLVRRMAARREPLLAYPLPAWRN